ncbi:sulfite exporter TauE/SafE family protein [Ottowia oryzae]|uniref:Probable membrane transporter protein n=1 Tax=Ottowia oryzae TaxID=2109914 RepID=A0A2S0MFL8_9BURK|nr:sulfite exporter TauE/SafE family protein [Ottowia oryzae]AVO34626.1 hypothetical protein C6570_10615 [Ottowia oryzae]
MGDTTLWLLSAAALVVGGLVKGALGVGLPLVAVPLLALWLPPAQAIGLLAAPVVLSNLIQAVEGGHLRASWRRFRWLVLAQLVATVLTVRMTLDLSPAQLNAMVAGAVLLAVFLLALQPNVQIPPNREQSIGIAVGLGSGLLGGVSSLTGPILITYFMALRLSRDAFVSSISLVYLAGSLPLYGAMVGFGKIAPLELGLSVLALLPVYLGMRLGRQVRQRLNEQVFRRVVLGLLVVIALILLTKG